MVQSKEVCEILKMAKENNINTIDTASDYGMSEDVLGRADVKKFTIVSKYAKSIGANINEAFDRSLNRMKVSRLYGYLLHNFSDFIETPSLYEEILKLRDDGRVDKTGFSLYTPSELDSLLKLNLNIGIIQVPYNIFDRRFESYFPELFSHGIEIHTRSVFLQGLFFIELTELPSWLLPVKDKLLQLNDFARNNDTNITEICLNFVYNNRFINKIILGHDNREQLMENLNALRCNEKISGLMEELGTFIVNDENIINPVKWKT